MYKFPKKRNDIHRKDDNMKQVPDMISTKDLSYLEDMFNWHFTLCKKAYKYSEEVENEEISKFFDKVYKNHKKICEKIIKKIGGTA